MERIYVSAAERTAERIREQILQEEFYRPLDKLPNESILAEQLLVSRTTVREAVKILVAEGILEIRRGRGTYVNENALSYRDPFGLFALEDKRQLALDYFELRQVLEPACAKLAAERATEAEIDAILCYERIAAEKIASGEQFTRADQDFHQMISRATHNPVIEKMMLAVVEAIRNAIDAAVYGGLDATARENALQNHRAVAQAIRERDPEGAALAMYTHIRRGMRDIGS